MERNENKGKFFRKLDKVIKTIEKITDKTKGYNFTYIDIEKILVEVDKAAAGHEMFVLTAPNWYVNEVTGQTDMRINQVGKEFVVEGSMKFSIVDIETGHVECFIKAAAGKGTDPGQAVGSAESYSLRQFLNKTFKVEIEKETDASTTKHVFDRHGDACVPLSTSEVSDIAGSLASKVGDSTSIKKYVMALLNRYNDHFKTNYGLLGEFPSSELKDLKSFTSAISKEELEKFDV